MGKHILFLIHGMGKFEQGWEKPVIKKLKTSYKALGLESRKGPLESLTDFVPIKFDTVFEDLRNQWRQANKTLTAQLALVPGLGDSLIGKIGEFTNFGTDDTFINTHLLDVIMYRFLPDTVAPDVEHQVMKQITEKIQADGGRPWSVMAHSLGTSVATNSLYRLFTTGSTVNGDVVPPLMAETHAPRSLMMLANVSRVLERRDGVYEGPVRPGGANGNKTLCREYISVKNIFDPFLMPVPFEQGQGGKDWVWKGPAGRKTDYHPLLVKHVKQLNVHAWDHYLDNPAVQIPTFEAILNNSFLFSDDATQNVLAKYSTRPGVDDLNKILDDLDEYLPDSADNALGFLKMAIKYLDQLKTKGLLEMIGLKDEL